MSTDQSNPYQPPSAVSEDRGQLKTRKTPLLLRSLSAVAVGTYVLFSIALVFGDSASDTRMGGLLLGSTPTMFLWLRGTWAGNEKASLFGWSTVVVQAVVGCLMLALLRRVHLSQVLLVNGTTVCVLVVLVSLYRFCGTKWQMGRK